MTRNSWLVENIRTRSQRNTALAKGIQHSLGDGLTQQTKTKMVKKNVVKTNVLKTNEEVISRLRKDAVRMQFDRVEPDYSLTLKAAMSHTATHYLGSTGTVVDLVWSVQPVFDIIYDRRSDVMFARIARPRTLRLFPNHDFKMGDVVSGGNKVVGNIFEGLRVLDSYYSPLTHPKLKPKWKSISRHPFAATR